MKEPLFLDTDDLDHLEEMCDALADGYHITAPDTEEKKHQYRELQRRIADARP